MFPVVNVETINFFSTVLFFFHVVVARFWWHTCVFSCEFTRKMNPTIFGDVGNCFPKGLFYVEVREKNKAIRTVATCVCNFRVGKRLRACQFLKDVFASCNDEKFQLHVFMFSMLLRSCHFAKLCLKIHWQILSPTI
jgi:hypothetical protein